MTESSIEIVAMNQEMLSSAAALHIQQYGGSKDKVTATLRRRFFSEYPQKNGKITLTAIMGNRVIGMMTYIPWPYVRNGQDFRSLQASGALVHPNFRGRKLFQRMLSEGNRLAIVHNYDFFTGFPVQMSYGGLIKDQWIDMGQLRWWIKPLSTLSILRQRMQYDLPTIYQIHIGKQLRIDSLNQCTSDGSGFQIASVLEFLKWRYAPDMRYKYRYFEYRYGNQHIGFVIKLSCRHGFSEVLIGRVHTKGVGVVALTRGLKALCSEARKSGLSAVSMATLRPSTLVKKSLILSGFFPAKLTIPLIVKPLRCIDSVTNPNYWRNIELEDMDTW